MKIDKLRYDLTTHVEKFMFTYDNYKLLIHPSINNDDLLNRLNDDLDLMPEIPSTIDDCDIKFYRYDYNEEIYSKSELLAFILASINSDWDIIKGIDFRTGKVHYYLKNGNIIYDPALGVITDLELHSKTFKRIRVIKNSDALEYLKEHNNLYRFYHKGIFNKKCESFSIDFINEIRRRFNNNVFREYELTDEKENEIKDWITRDNFILLRQVLTKKRKSYIQSSNISVHPSVDPSILDLIGKYSGAIKSLMKQEYDIDLDYYNGTLGNCYALSIMLNLFNGEFKLVQGYIPYKSSYYSGENSFYQHSWLEYQDVVYDPAFRIVTPKDLYYRFVCKQDEYSREDTENILRRIGFNLTHFKDFLRGKQIGGDETIRYRSLVNKIDSLEFKEEGEKLLELVRKFNK